VDRLNRVDGSKDSGYNPCGYMLDTGRNLFKRTGYNPPRKACGNTGVSMQEKWKI